MIYVDGLSGYKYWSLEDLTGLFLAPKFLEKKWTICLL